MGFIATVKNQIVLICYFFNYMHTPKWLHVYKHEIHKIHTLSM